MPTPTPVPMCSLVEDFTKELGKKPEITCWGCGKKEKKGEKKFRQCPKCVELKIMPSLFCSDECFKNNWSRHRKEVHNLVIKELPKSDLQTEQKIDRLFEQHTTNTDNNPYKTTMLKGQQFQLKNDWINAKKQFRKAQKLYPKFPDAYCSLGHAYFVSGQLKEGLTFMEAGIERWACACLTGQYGDTRVVDMEHALKEGLAKGIWSFLQPLITKGDVPSYNKPDWFCNEFVLKRIIDMVKEAIMIKPKTLRGLSAIMSKDQEHKYIQKLNLWQGMVLYGAIHDGNVNLSDLSKRPRGDRTVQDLTEAAECFRKSSECFGSVKDSNYLFNMVADRLTEYVKTWETTPMNSAPFYKGCFVLVFGLTSTMGKTQMNKKLGIVRTSRSADGRYGVQIDGHDEPKSIRGKNLMLLPLPDRDVAMVSCMAPASQWKYLRPIGEGYATRLPDPE